jgi:hypothetical protein
MVEKVDFFSFPSQSNHTQQPPSTNNFVYNNHNSSNNQENADTYTDNTNGGQGYFMSSPNQYQQHYPYLLSSSQYSPSYVIRYENGHSYVSTSSGDAKTPHRHNQPLTITTKTLNEYEKQHYSQLQQTLFRDEHGFIVNKEIDIDLSQIQTSPEATDTKLTKLNGLD